MHDPTFIHQVADTTSQRDRDALDRSVVQLLYQFLDADAITLHRVTHDGERYRVSRRLLIEREHGDLTAAASDEIASLPFLSDTPVWEQCIRRDEVLHLALPNSIYRALFPVVGSREVAGRLEIDTRAPMEPRDSDLVHGILRILRNQLSLLDYGERDELTGLLNRRTFEARFDKLGEHRRSSRKQTSEPGRRWLGLLDIDHFKSINDTYGHLFGDEVLLLVSRIMVGTLGGKEGVFRFGGEEFVIMLEEPSALAARDAFERVRSAIDSHAFPQIGHVTASLGYTEIKSHDVPATSMERADAALYYAKRNGRNNIREYEALIASGDLVDKKMNDEMELF